uniref:Predicted protein n=1 Tax=Hordeum vulgare subsp. vulgare TaxID=112509 RepID=F2D9F7_HORVV|nr:predicted protein [Hordeum vulgare subsp. vulgare]
MGDLPLDGPPIFRFSSSMLSWMLTSLWPSEASLSTTFLPHSSSGSAKDDVSSLLMIPRSLPLNSSDEGLPQLKHLIAHLRVRTIANSNWI